MALTRTETTQADWQAGTLSNVVATSGGDLVLANTPAQLYDDFSGNLSKWDVSTITATISSGQVDLKLAQSVNGYMISTTTFYGDGYVQVDVEAVTGTSEQWVSMHDSSSSSELRAGFSVGNIYLQGLGVNLSKAYAITTGTYYTVKVEKVGTTVNAYVNGVLQLTGTATQNLASWKAYIYQWSGSVAPEMMADNVYVKDSSYYASGTRTSPALDLSSVGIAASSRIAWTATTPTNTAVAVDVSLDGGTTWQSATNSGAIPGITPGMNLSGKSLLVRQTLSTTDPTVTPTLSDLTVTVGALQSATATAQGGATESVSVAWNGYVRASAQADGSVAAMANFLAAASGMAIASSSAEWNERIHAVSATATAGATVDASAIRLLIQTLVINAVIQPGDIVEIDTSRMAVKINGVNALQFSEGDFFALLPGTNYLEYQDSETQRNVQIITRHRPRWI